MSAGEFPESQRDDATSASGRSNNDLRWEGKVRASDGYVIEVGAFQKARLGLCNGPAPAPVVSQNHPAVHAGLVS